MTGRSVVRRRKPLTLAAQGLEPIVQLNVTKSFALERGLELPGAMCEAVKASADINAGIAHVHYSHTLCPIPRFIRDSLAKDLD